MALLTSYTDEQLLQLLATGDEAAFSEIYNRYWEQLSLYTVKITKSQEEAMDIVQADKKADQDVLIAIIDKIRMTLDNERAIARATMLANDKTPQAALWKVVLAYLYLQGGAAPVGVEEADESLTDSSE